MIYLNKYGWTLKDEKFRLFYKKHEIKKNVIKTLCNNKIYNDLFKIYFMDKFSFYTKKSSISVYRNSCIIRKTGKVVFRMFKLGRHVSKFYSSMGLLVGLRKSSF